MIREEVSRLCRWEDRHRRLMARILIALGLTLVVDVAAAVLIRYYESGVYGSDVHGFGDSLFFTTVQLLTVSSQLRNPVTHTGKFIDVGLEIWALFVVSAIAGSFAAFFLCGDSSD